MKLYKNLVHLGKKRKIMFKKRRKFLHYKCYWQKLTERKCAKLRIRVTGINTNNPSRPDYLF